MHPSANPCFGSISPFAVTGSLPEMVNVPDPPVISMISVCFGSVRFVASIAARTEAASIDPSVVVT